MPKPTSIPTWATDAGARVDPGPARQASGFLPGKKLPAKWLNWALAQGGEWFQYLRDLHLEPEFLSKNYSWSGVHRFAAGYIANHWGVSGEVLYADAFGNVAPKARVAYLPLRIDGHAPPLATSVRISHSIGVVQFYTAQGTGFHEVDLPSGCVVTRVEAGVVQTSSGADSFAKLGVRTVTPSGSTNVLDPETVASAGATQGVPETLAVDGSWTLDNALRRLQLRIEAPNGPGLSGIFLTVYWLKVTYTDPGPRNF
jgi:hypothetical protein